MNKSIKINTDKLCHYGCGNIAKYEFMNGKYCCKNHYSKCNGYKIKENRNTKRITSIKNKKFHMIKLTNETHLCDYGCGKTAKYFFNLVNKYCCSKHYLKCPSKHLETVEKSTFQKFDNSKKIICDYGCGGLAKYKSPITNKYCCSKNWASCQVIKLKNSLTNIIMQTGNKNGMYGKTHTKETKRKLQVSNSLASHLWWINNKRKEILK